jgi:hypothetical protein
MFCGIFKLAERRHRESGDSIVPVDIPGLEGVHVSHVKLLLGERLPQCVAPFSQHHSRSLPSYQVC